MAKSNKPEDAKCPDVAKFDGTWTKLQEFENKLETYFELKPKFLESTSKYKPYRVKEKRSTVFSPGAKPSDPLVV